MAVLIGSLTNPRRRTPHWYRRAEVGTDLFERRGAAVSDVQPKWQDVQSSAGRAMDAIDRCRSVAAALRHANDRRNSLAAMAREEWRGRFREEFDADVPALTGATSALAGVLDTLAAAVEAAAGAARQEQAWREEQRRSWAAQQVEAQAPPRP